MSPSLSPSPSEGWESYSRGDYAALPADDTDLETAYSEQDYLDVDADDATRVAQTATDEYAIHQFKDHAGENMSASLTWNGQSDVAPSSSIVKLQIYNYDTPAWEDVDSNNAANADTDFTLSGNIADLTDYKSPTNYITCRVWQEAA